MAKYVDVTNKYLSSTGGTVNGILELGTRGAGYHTTTNPFEQKDRLITYPAIHSGGYWIFRSYDTPSGTWLKLIWYSLVSETETPIMDITNSLCHIYPKIVAVNGIEDKTKS